MQQTPFGRVQSQTTCPDCGGSVKSLRKNVRIAVAQVAVVKVNLSKINIPAGVDNGTRLRMAGEGEAGENGGPSGDLYIYIRVRPHADLYQR